MDECRACRVARTFAFILALLIPAGVLAWWEFLDYEILGPPVEHYSEEMLTEDIYPGTEVEIRWRYAVLRDCHRVVDLWLEESTGEIRLLRRHSGTSRGRPPGKRDIISAVKLNGVMPGETTLRSIAEFHCNPLRSYVQVIEVDFTVKPPPGPQ